MPRRWGRLSGTVRAVTVTAGDRVFLRFGATAYGREATVAATAETGAYVRSGGETAFLTWEELEAAVERASRRDRPTALA